MSARNASTAPQRRFIESLARRVGQETFIETFNAVASLTHARHTHEMETINQAAKRLSRKNASELIDRLKTIADAA